MERTSISSTARKATQREKESEHAEKKGPPKSMTNGVGPLSWANGRRTVLYRKKEPAHPVPPEEPSVVPSEYRYRPSMRTLSPNMRRTSSRCDWPSKMS